MNDHAWIVVPFKMRHAYHARSCMKQARFFSLGPATLADAVRLASQQETVEAAQKRLHRERSVHESMAVHAGHLEGEDESTVSSARGKHTPDVECLSRQLRESDAAVLQLTAQLEQLKGRRVRQEHAEQDNYRHGPRDQFANQEDRMRNTLCWSCGVRGHVKRNCPRLKRTKAKGTVAAVSSTLMVCGYVSGRSTRILLDTGSAVTLISEDVWKELKLKNDSHRLESPVQRVVTASGEKLELVGQCTMIIKIGGLSAAHTILIARSLTQECLLGAVSPSLCVRFAAAGAVCWRKACIHVPTGRRCTRESCCLFCAYGRDH